MSRVEAGPVLSVIVTITSGAPNLRRCLTALKAAATPKDLDIIVPVLRTLDRTADLEREFPDVRFIDVPDPVTTAEARHPGRMHVVYDRRRSVGLQAARTALVAITEDHVIPPPGWCAAVIAQHERFPVGVIGGSIQSAGTSLLTRALFQCDFSRYQPPAGQRSVPSISDINVSYKRRVLAAVEPFWRDLYHETHVHEAVRSLGESLRITDEMKVLHDRGPVSWPDALRERFSWARLYAARRYPKTDRVRRFGMAAASLLLPALLTWRHGRNAVRSGMPVWNYLILAPVILVLTSVAAVGEMTGYLTGREYRGLAKAFTPRNMPAAHDRN